MVSADCTMDLELIAQRVLKLAEIATFEHLQGLLDSQAQGVLAMAAEAGYRHDGDAARRGDE